jgi:hypothetical protein
MAIFKRGIGGIGERGNRGTVESRNTIFPLLKIFKRGNTIFPLLKIFKRGNIFPLLKIIKRGNI